MKSNDNIYTCTKYIITSFTQMNLKMLTKQNYMIFLMKFTPNLLDTNMCRKLLSSPNTWLVIIHVVTIFSTKFAFFCITTTLPIPCWIPKWICLTSIFGDVYYQFCGNKEKNWRLTTQQYRDWSRLHRCAF